MAIFKDKTGRGEVDYAKSPVQGSDGTILYLNDHTGNTSNVYAYDNGLQTNHLVFQLRGESLGVKDISNNRFSVTESSALTKRQEFVTHTQKLKTFEFSNGKTISLTPKVQQRYQNPGSLSGSPELGRDQSHGSSPIETIIPASVTGTRIGDGGSAEVIISFWVYINQYSTGTNGGGSCIMEQVSGTARTFGVILSSTGELVFRWYDWGADSTSAVNFQQVKTQGKLNLKKWYHITIFAKGGGSPAADNDDNYAYNNAGLDSTHQDHSTGATGLSPFGLPQVAIFINGKEQINPSESGLTSGNFTGTLSSDPLFPVVLGAGLAGYDNGIPQFQSGTDANFIGRLAEVSYFYTDRLARQLNSLSNSNSNYRSVIANALLTGKRQPTSGITNVSERLLLRDLDQSSTHPTVKRSGDQRRLGDHLIQFDDSRAQTFKGATVHYPTKLVEGDNLIDTIYGGYFNGDLTLSHTASVESYDTFYRREDQPAHEPFVESRIYIDSGSSFYQTGTLESVLPGFDRPLRDKEFVQINLKNNQTCQLGSNPTESYYNSFTDNLGYNRGRVDYMAYWNSNGFFEKKPGITFHQTTSDENNRASQNNILTGSCLGFLTSRNIWTGSADADFNAKYAETYAALGKLTVSQYPESYINSLGKPSDLFAFPDDSRYEATGSNLINMSDYISEPFLVEKIIYNFSELDVRLDILAQSGANSMTGVGYDGFSGFIASPDDGDIVTPGDPFERYVQISQGLESLHCFLMRQYPQPVTGSRSITWKRSTTTFTSASAQFSSDTQRDMIDYQTKYFTKKTSESADFMGTVISALDTGVLSSSYITSSYSNVYDYIQQLFDSGDSLEIKYLENAQAGSGINGYPTESNMLYREIFESKVKTIPRNNFAGTFNCLLPNDPSSTATISAKWIAGPANLSNQVSPRHTVKSIAGSKNLQQIRVGTLGGLAPTFTDVIVSDQDGSGEAPYVLLPSDKLIFGVQSISPVNSQNMPTHSGVQIKSGDVKITLIGSYVRNSQPRQFQLNQLLNNDIVHEAIGQEPISDQFDIEPRGAFTGSYVDEVMSGSTVAPYNGYEHFSETTTDLARRIAGRSSEGTQGVTGSLKRTLSIVSADKTEYDSFLFDLESIFKVDARTSSTGFVGGDYFDDIQRPFGKVDYVLATNDSQLEDDVTLSSTDNTIKPNIHFRTSYLFSRYGSVPRVRKDQILAQNSQIAYNLTGSDLYNYQSLDGYIATNPDYPSNLQFSDGDGDGEFIAIFSTLEGLQASRHATPSEISPFLFGLGDGPKSAHYFDALSLYSGNDQAFFNIRDIRGFKYGLSNIADKKPRNVFRRDRYGQLRDMLEMAPNTAYIDDITNTISYPVEAQFFADDGSTVTPDATSSSNLSTYVTSSAPFFDREVVDFDDPLVVRNRGPLNNKVADITIEI